MRPDRPLAAAFLLLLGLSLAGLPSLALAAGCTVTAAGGVAFGTYHVFDTSPLDSTGTISVSCTAPYSPSVLVKISAGLSSSFAPRKLRSGSHFLEYNLFLDASRATIWGDGTSGTSVSTQAPAGGVNLDLTLYGRIPARQNARAGTYSDTLVVTVEF